MRFLASVNENQGFDCVQNDTFGLYGVNCKTEPHEKTFQVVLPGFKYFTSFDMNILGGKFFTCHRVVNIEPKRGKILEKRLYVSSSTPEPTMLYNYLQPKYIVRTGGWLSQARPGSLYKRSIMCSEPAAPEMPPPFWCPENQISRTEILR